ncbi:MAG: DUF2326 domain-containing protein [Ruminococcus sp.]|nr:DUF2326 domain-containing protein [Ruminococcus sp.]
MTFESISIINLKGKKQLAYYKFNRVGVNIILGEKNNNNDDTNGVGKTALFLAIRYCISEKLPIAFAGKQELEKNDAYVILSIETNGKVQRIRRCLFDDSIVYVTENDSIDNFSTVGWDTYDKKGFSNYIQRIMYSKINLKPGETLPNFASIRELLMRDERQGYAADINLPNRNAAITSKCLAFISSVQCNFEEQLSLIKNKINELKDKQKLIASFSKDIDELREKHQSCLKEIEILKNMLSNASVGEKIEYDQERYTELKRQIDTLHQKIHQLEFSKRQQENNKVDLKENVDKVREFIHLEDFYNQILNYFPNQLSCNYKQMYEFYQAMLDDRGSYFDNQIKAIDGKLNILYSQREILLKELSKITTLIKNSKLVSDLQSISNQINEKHKLIAEYEYKLNIYSEKDNIDKSIKAEKEKFNEEQKRLIEIFDSYSNVINDIKSYFNNLINISCLTPKAISGKLEYSFENSNKSKATNGRIKIKCEISDQDSYGRGNLKIILFDLALLLNRIDRNMGLTFLFHDGPYVQITQSKIKFNILIYIDKILKEKNMGQYFVTMNVEELQDSVPYNGETISMMDYFNNLKFNVARLLRTDDSKQRFMGFKY